MPVLRLLMVWRIFHGGVEGAVLKPLVAKYKCAPKSNGWVHCSNDADQEAFVRAAFFALMDEAWKPGTQVMAQWRVYPELGDFELIAMESPAWVGMQYQDIVQVVAEGSVMFEGDDGGEGEKGNRLARGEKAGVGGFGML